MEILLIRRRVRLPLRGARGRCECASFAPPLAEVVTLTVPEEGEKAVIVAISRVKKSISLKNLGIASVNSKKAMIEGLILEILDPDGHAKADRLPVQMAENA